MSVIPTVYNQGTGLIGSTTSGAAIPSNIDDLIVNDTLLVGGEATFNGAVTVNNSLTVSGGISFQDVTVQGTFILEGKTPTQLAFYTTGGELTGTADMTYSGGVTTLTNVTVTTALSFGALTKTDSNNYAVAFHDNNRICVAGSPNVLTYNPFDGLLAVPNVTVGDELTVTNNLQVTSGNVTLTSGDITMTSGTLTANIVTADEMRIQPIDVTSQDNFLPIPIIDTTNQNQVVVDGDINVGVNNLSYNPLSNTFKTKTAQFTGNVNMDANVTVEDDLTLTNGDLVISNGDLSIGQLPEGNYSGVDFEMAFFNPNNGKFFKRTGYTLRGNTAVLTLDEVEISDTLTVTNDTTLGRTFINPTSRNNNEDYRIALIDKDNGQICREQNDNDFFYNTLDNELNVKNLVVSTSANITGLTITPGTRGTTSTDYQIVFYDATTSQFCIDDNSTQFTYDPNLNQLKVETIRAGGSVIVDDYLTLTTPPTTVTGDNPITFLATNNRFYIAPSANPFTYDASTNTLKASNINVAVNLTSEKLTLDTGSIFNHSANTYMGIRGQYTTNFDFSIALWSDGHTRYQTSENGGGHRFYVRDTVNNTTVQKFQIDDNQITCSTELFANNGATILASTFSDDINCRVTFIDSNSNTGKVVSNNQLFFNPDNETLRTSNMNVNGQLNVTAPGLNSGQMNVDSTLYFVYNHATGHTFRIAGNWKLRLFNTSTVIYTPLFLQDVTVPAASASLPILCHNNSNEVKKTNVSGTNQITVDPFQGRLTTKDIYVTGAIYNNSFGPVLNYVVTFSTRINGTGDAYTTNGTSGTWGNDALIQWPTQASAGGEPKVSQYGSNITDGTGTKYGAVVFTESTTDTEFMLLSDNYSGWWFVDISLLWQNTSNTRQMPRIDLGKRLTAGGAITEQPQVNQGSGYTRYDSGELLNLHICGPVYMASAANKFVILTKLEDAATSSGGIAVPPNWSDSTTGYKALGLNITCKYLGNAEDAGETVNTL